MSTFDNEIIQTVLYISIKIPRPNYRPNYRQNFSRAKDTSYYVYLKPGICIYYPNRLPNFIYILHIYLKGKTHYQTKRNTYNTGMRLKIKPNFCSSLDGIWTHTIDTLQHHSLSLTSSALDHSTTSTPFKRSCNIYCFLTRQGNTSIIEAPFKWSGCGRVV